MFWRRRRVKSNIDEMEMAFATVTIETVDVGERRREGVKEAPPANLAHCTITNSFLPFLGRRWFGRAGVEPRPAVLP